MTPSSHASPKSSNPLPQSAALLLTAKEEDCEATDDNVAEICEEALVVSTADAEEAEETRDTTALATAEDLLVETKAADALERELKGEGGPNAEATLEETMFAAELAELPGAATGQAGKNSHLQPPTHSSPEQSGT